MGGYWGPSPRRPGEDKDKDKDNIYYIYYKSDISLL